MEKKSGKKKIALFLGKLGSLVAPKHKPEASHNAFALQQQLAPLSAANNSPLTLKKQQLAITACRPQDDCGQNPASSDQTSQVARIDEQPIDSYASEHFGSECSLTESVRAATAHMAQLRSLLVNHISETHDAGAVHGKLAGPSLLAALHEQQQQQQRSSLELHEGFPSRPGSRLQHCGSPNTDRKVQALLADQMQLLDLVQTLIADHRTSLLEQQRLQQQLAATQEALNCERLDKDRAAALAQVRSEEVCQAQADLAAASATVQQLHSDAKRVISSRRLQLPPANTAAGTGTDGLLVSASILSDGDAGDAAESQQGHGSGRGSAIIGRVAPEDSWQDMPAIVGPAPVACAHQPLSAGAAATAPLAPGSSGCRRQHRSSTKAAITGSAVAQPPDSNKAGSSNSSRSSRRVAAGSAGTEAAHEQQHRVRQRRLLGDASSKGSGPGSTGSKRGAWHRAGVQSSDSRSSHESQRSLGDACVHVQLVQQQQQQGGTSATVAAAAAPRQAAAGNCSKRKQWERPMDILTARQPVAVAATASPDRAENDCTADADGNSDSDSSSLRSDSSSYSDAEGVTETGEADSCSNDSSDDDDDKNSGRSDGSSDHGGSDNSSIAAAEQHQLVRRRSSAAGAAAGSSVLAAAGTRQQQQQQHDGQVQPCRSSTASRRGGHVCSSNGSSWPGMTTSLLADAAQAGIQAQLQPPPNPKPSPLKRPRQSSSRSRTQPVQISTSLESAAPLPLAAAGQHAMGSSSQGSSLAPTAALQCPTCSIDSASCTCSCLAGMAGGKGKARSSSGSSSSKHRRGGSSSSGGRLPATPSTELAQQQSTAAARAAAASAGSVRGSSRQRQRVVVQPQQQQRRQPGCSSHPAHSEQGTPSQQPLPAVAAAAAAATATTTVDAGCDSDGGLSAASAATGCTTLSNLAGIDLQTKSQVKPRPPIVPKLELPLLSTAQQLQQHHHHQQQQQWGHGSQPGPAAASTGQQCSTANSRALLIANQSDMAPLRAQPGSSRARGSRTPRVPTPGRTAHEPSCSPAPSAAAAGVDVVEASGSATAATQGQQVCVVEQQQQQQGQQTAASSASPAGSSQARRCSAAGSGSAAAVAAGSAVTGGAAVSARVGSASGSATGTGCYWGSSAGSCPASEEPSRQPTPTGELVVGHIYVPAAAGLAAVEGQRAPSESVGVLSAAADPFGSVVISTAAAAVTGECDDQASEGGASSAAAGSTGSTVYGPAAQEFYQPVPGAQQAAQVLTIATPRGTTVTPRGLTPSSAAAAAAGSYMTMRPAHMYKSVSTVYAMYSPLRGGLRALGHGKAGAAGPSGSAAMGVGLTCEQELVAGQAGLACEVGFGLLGAAPGAAGSVPGAVGEQSTGNASEYHWQALLGTVPEDEGVMYASSDPSQQQQHEQERSVPAAAAAAGMHAAADSAVASAAARTVDGVLSSPSPVSGASDGEQCCYYDEAARLGAAPLPTRQDFQLMVQQEMQQQQQQPATQQQQQGQLEKDVVERGPLFRPGSTGSTSPDAASVRSSAVQRSGGNSTNMTRSQHSCQQQQQQLRIPSPDFTNADAVGPLTASSPTRRRNSSSVSSSVSTGAAALQEQRRRHQQHSLRQHRGQNPGSAATSTAAVARVEAAAAVVAARVAAVAARSSNRRQQQQHPAEQRQASTEAGVAAAVEGGSAGQQQQQQQHDRAGRLQSASSPGPSRAAPKDSKHRQPLKQRQQRQAGDAAAAEAGSSSRTAASGSSCTSQANNGHELVTSYYNPMVTLEDAGLGAADEEALVNAGLLPGFSAAAAQGGLPLLNPHDALLLPGCRSELGVHAAAVPAHVTPLAKERSAGGGAGGGQGGPVCGEGSGAAGGQLHWNPLYDPNAMESSALLGYMAE